MLASAGLSPSFETRAQRVLAISAGRPVRGAVVCSLPKVVQAVYITSPYAGDIHAFCLSLPKMFRSGTNITSTVTYWDIGAAFALLGQILLHLRL